jgi:hypothetical protein
MVRTGIAGEHSRIIFEGTARTRARVDDATSLAYGAAVGDYTQSYSTEISSSVDDCFKVLVDFEAYPQWSSPVRECTVIDRHPDGLARRVEFKLDMTIKTIRYVLEYAYEAPTGARWRLVEGDVRAVEGTYHFESHGDRTTATCTQSIDLGFWIPGFVRRSFEQRALRESVEEFRKAVEQRQS